MVVVGVFALVLAISPLGQAAAAPRHVTLGTPYAGTPVLATYASATGCGASFALTKLPSFNKTTGIATTSHSGSAKGCSTPFAPDATTVETIMGLGTKGFVTTTGIHKVVVHWSLLWNNLVTAAPLPVGTGLVYGTAILLVHAYIFDGTNGTTFVTDSWLTSNTTSNGTVSFHGAATVSLYLNGSLLHTHTYYIVTFVESISTAYVSMNFGTASSSVNLATAGDHAKLTSITRT